MSQDSASTPATAQIYEWIENNLNGREKDTNVNRASAASNCVKRRWFQAKGYPGEKLKPRSILVFGLGDLVEHWYKNLIEQACVGPDRLYSEVDFGKKTGSFIVQHREFSTYEQETLTISLTGLELTGHPDGWGRRNSDAKWELIEVKSAATFGYDKFVQGETPDYIKQVHASLLSDKAKQLGADGARFFYMKKETSHIYDRYYQFDPKLALQVIEEFFAAQAEIEPATPYPLVEETYYKKPTGRMIAGYPCNYCPYVTTCHRGVELEFTKQGKPVYVLKQKKEGSNGRSK